MYIFNSFLEGGGGEEVRWPKEIFMAARLMFVIAESGVSCISGYSPVSRPRICQKLKHKYAIVGFLKLNVNTDAPVTFTIVSTSDAHCQ